MAALSHPVNGGRFLRSQGSNIRCRLRTWLFTAITLAIHLSIPAHHASAAANRELQARVLIRGIVSRVAFYSAIGSAIDLPVRLSPCASSETRNRTYSTIKKAIEGSTVNAATYSTLCHPHVEQVQNLTEKSKRLTFSLPSKLCSKIKTAVTNIIADITGDLFHSLLDPQAQNVVQRIFQGRARGYINTSGPLRFEPFVFIVDSCVELNDESELSIIMQKRN